MTWIAVVIPAAPVWADAFQHSGLYVAKAAKDDAIAWASPDTIVFIGNVSGGVTGKRPTDSLYLWKLGTPPKEVIPAPSEITTIKALGDGRVAVETVLDTCAK
jgi:hypothetical protein